MSKQPLQVLITNICEISKAPFKISRKIVPNYTLHTFYVHYLPTRSSLYIMAHFLQATFYAYFFNANFHNFIKITLIFCRVFK